MARRRRAGTRRTADIRQVRTDRAGILAHNARLFGAVNARFWGVKKDRLGLAQAKIQRVRRKGRIANPRLAAYQARGRESAHDPRYRGAGGRVRMLVGDPAKITRLGGFNKLHPRDKRGRFVRKKVG